MLTYNNDPALKAAFLAEVRRHQDADQIVKGAYGEIVDGKWRGCAIGCAIHSLNTIQGTNYLPAQHEALEVSGLWPVGLSHLEDVIFEHLPVDKAVKWPLRFARAVPVGVDLQTVKWQFCAFLMRENINYVSGLDFDSELKTKILAAIEGVLRVLDKAISTGTWDARTAHAAADAAYAAADAADADAAYTVAAAAYAAADAADSAADAGCAANTVTNTVANTGAYVADYDGVSVWESYADKLIALLEASAPAQINSTQLLWPVR